MKILKVKFELHNSLDEFFRVVFGNTERQVKCEKPKTGSFFVLLAIMSRKIQVAVVRRVQQARSRHADRDDPHGQAAQ